MKSKEIVVNLKSIRMSVTKKMYDKLMEADSKSYEELGERIVKKIGPVGMGYMIESIEDGEE